MASTKEYLEYVVERIEAAGFGDVRSRAMMGEYLLYVNDVLIGGVYDDRFLVKCVEGNSGFGMEEVLPYDGAVKKMRLVGEVDDVEGLKKIIDAMVLRARRQGGLIR